MLFLIGTHRFIELYPVIGVKVETLQNLTDVEESPYMVNHLSMRITTYVMLVPEFCPCVTKLKIHAIPNLILLLDNWKQ